MVIRNGQVIYRRGFGFADVNGGKVAHGETVYNAASVAKVIGATLAGKLEAEDRLRDGTTFSLDLYEQDVLLPDEGADRRRPVRHHSRSAHP